MAYMHRNSLLLERSKLGWNLMSGVLPVKWFDLYDLSAG